MSKKSFGCAARCSGASDRSHAELWALREMGMGVVCITEVSIQEYNPVIHVSLGARGAWERVGAGTLGTANPPTSPNREWSKIGEGQAKSRSRPPGSSGHGRHSAMYRPPTIPSKHVSICGGRCPDLSLIGDGRRCV